MLHDFVTVRPAPASPRGSRSGAVRRRLLPALLCLLSLPLLAGQASALSERIVFDFTSGSSISLLGGTILIPPDGTLDTGTARVEVEAAAPGVFVPGGQVLLENLAVAGTVSKTIPGAALISGTYAASQVGTLTGTLAPGLDGGLFGDPLSLLLDVDVACTGSGCALLGFPISQMGISLLSIGLLGIDDLGIPGAARIEASVPIEIGGVLGTLDLVGVEVSRTFIPEPGTLALLALGLGVLGARRTS